MDSWVTSELNGIHSAIVFSHLDVPSVEALSSVVFNKSDSGESMRAWTVDADDIRVADDFDESLLHRTPEIDGFLTPDRDDKFIVIATKGFAAAESQANPVSTRGPRHLPAQRQPAG
jgi:hypothetical protein